MNLKLARIFVVFTGFLALCSVGAALLLGLRLRADRGVLLDLQQTPDCTPAPPTSSAKKGR